jgi:uncharacterized protein (TIGR02271 family)
MVAATLQGLKKVEGRRSRMTTTQQVVVGVFDDRSQAEQAVNELRQAGFSDDQIRYSGHGASSGGILETLKSLFTGQDTGRVYDDLVNLGVSADDANYYQHEFEAGRAIVAVLTGGRMQDATSILARYGGYGASRRFAGTGDYTTDTGRAQRGTEGDYTTDTGAAQTGTEDAQRLKLREEQLRVQKQPVQTGEARLRKDVVSEQQSMDVPVTHEEVYIERRPGSGQPSDTPIGESETYRVPVREEQVTTSKQAVETGEVAMGKRKSQETQPVSDTVRREEAHVERSGDVNVQGSDVEDTTDQTDQTTP